MSTIIDRRSFRSIVYSIIVIANVITSIMLVKQYGSIGCAIATGISFILLFLMGLNGDKKTEIFKILSKFNLKIVGSSI